MDQKFKGNKVRLLIGIGNPGKEYQETYHNVGFLFINYLTEKEPPISNFKFLIFKNFEYLKIQKTIIAKTTTFMNTSGSAIREALTYFKLKPENLLIAHDDADIGLGEQRLVFGRGAAGHKGVESIIKTLKTKNFWRFRIGIRPIEPISPRGPIGQRKKAGEFVLKKISSKNKELLLRTFKEAAEAMKTVTDF